MIVKVCGITNQEDATAAVEAGANALGFNFYPESPRYLPPELAARIDTAGARRVGVFVNETLARVEEIVRQAALDVAQLHGDETAADFPHCAVWKAARVRDDFRLTDYDGIAAEALLLDGPAEALYGGAGLAFDWRLAAGAKLKIILAGGLDGGNVARAIRAAKPWGVDACSRIESAPGKKDHRKMNDFLQAARAALGE